MTENMRPQCALPHQPLKIDLPVAGFITRSLLEKDQTSGIYKNLNQARDQIVNLIKDGSIGSKKQFETIFALLNQQQSDFEQLAVLLNQNHQGILDSLEEKHQRMIDEIQAKHQLILDEIRIKHTQLLAENGK